jgi:uncharacterized membrane protein (DUF106 family)
MSTDTQDTIEFDAVTPEPAKPSRLSRLFKAVKQHLAPNRITIYVTGVIDVTAAVLVVLSSFDPEQVGGIVAAVAGINALAVKFLTGWQKMEGAEYQARLISLQDQAVQAQQGREAELVALSQAQRKPNVRLPR